MATNPTGYSAPPSELDVSVVNISSSSGSTAVRPAPTKKLRPTTAETGATPSKGGSPVASVGTTTAVPALVATLRTSNVELHTAAQTVTSSSSSISVTSSASRLRRLDLARAEHELAEARAIAAEARLKVLRADLEFAAGSQAGSVGRRMDDVQSEVGSVRDQSRDEFTDLPLLQLHTDVALQQPTTTRDEYTPNQFDGVFSLEREVTPSIYDVFSLSR